MIPATSIKGTDIHPTDLLIKSLIDHRMDKVFNDPTVLDGYILEKNRLGARSIADIRIQALDWVDGADYPVAHSLSIGQLANSKPLLRIMFVYHFGLCDCI